LSKIEKLKEYNIIQDDYINNLKSRIEKMKHTSKTYKYENVFYPKEEMTTQHE